MKNSLLSIHLSLYILLYAHLAIAQVPGKAISKFNKKYEKGAYAAATKYATKGVKQSKNDTQLAFYHLLRAKALEASGQYALMDSTISIGLGYLKKIPADSVLMHCQALHIVSDTWKGYENYAKSSNYLDQILEKLNTTKRPADSIYMANVLLEKAYILCQTGHYNEALAIIKDQMVYRDWRATQLVAYRRGTNIQYKKLSKTEQKLRYKEKGKLKVVYNLVLLKKGDYKLLDSTLNNDYLWIKKNIGSTSLEARDILITKALKYEIEKEKRKATNTFLKAFRKSKAKFSEKRVLDILEKVIYSYNAENDRHRARKYVRKFESALSLEYGRKNPQYLRYDLLDVQTAYQFSKFDKANKKLRKISAGKIKVPTDHPLRARMLQYSYNLNAKSSNFDPAQDSLIKLLEVKKALYGEQSPEYHKVKLELANFLAVYSSKFNEAKAIEDYSWDKVVAPQLSPQNLEYIGYLQQLATLYDLIDKYDQAINQLNLAANTVEKYYGKENITYATALQRLAEEYIKKGDFAKGESLIREAVELMKKVSNKENAVNQSATYLTLAKLFTTMGQYDEAEKALKKAKKSSKKAKSTGAEQASKSSDELADFYIKNGSYHEAENLLDRSLYLKEKRYGANNKELIPTLNQMGTLYLIKGNYNGADKVISRSMRLTSKIFGDSSTKYTECLKLREDLYKKIGELVKAEESAVQKLRIQKNQLGNNHIDLAATMSDIGLLNFYSTKDSKFASEYLYNATEIVKKNIGTDNPQYANQITSLAIFYIETKQYDKADSLLKNANKIWVRILGEKNVNSADIAFLEGSIFYKQEKYKEAQIKFILAKDIYRKIFSNQHPGYVKACSKLAHTYYINGEYAKALKIMDEITVTYLSFTQKFFPSLSFNEKAKYWNLIKEDFEFYNSLAMRLKEKNPQLIQKMYNNTLATKALLLSSSIKVKERIINSRDEQLINKYNEWIGKKEFMTSIISLSNETLKEMGVNLSVLEKEITTLEKDLSESSEVFASNADKRTFTWKSIKASLLPNEYAIEILRFRHFDHSFSDSIVYAALIISPQTTKSPEIVVLSNGKELESKYLKYYRNATRNQSDDNYSYEKYWQPIKAKINDGASVFLSAEGVYNQINIEALLSDQNYYAIDKNDFLLLSNTKDLAIHRSEEKVSNGKKAILCGNPTFYANTTAKVVSTNKDPKDRSATIADKSEIKKIKKTDQMAKDLQRDFRSSEAIAELPGTEEEINNLSGYLQTKEWEVNKYTQSEADEDSIKAIRQPSIFHIATHGFFKEDISTEEISGLSATESEFTQNPLLRSGLLLKGAGDVLKSSSILDINSEKGVLTAYEAMNLNLDNTDLVVLSACETGLGQIQIGEGVFGLQRSFLVAGANTVVMSLFKVNDEVTQKLMTRFYERWLKSGDKRKSFSEAKKEIKAIYPQPIYWGSFVMTGL